MKKNKRLQRLLVFLLWMGVWQAGAWLLGSSFLLPGPVQTISAFARLLCTAAFWRSAGMTLARVMGGYALAVVAGVLLATLCAFSRAADALLSPLRTVIRATPVTSFIILVLLWLRVDVLPLFIAFLMVLPIIWTNVQEGIAATDPLLLEMARLYRFGRAKTWRLVYLQSLLPTLTAACATGLGFAWKSGVAAEVIAKPALAIGTNLNNAKVYLETPDLFAWTLLVIVLSMLLEGVLMRGIRLLGARQGRKRP